VDQLIAFFADFFNFIYMSFYVAFSSLYESAAKGNAFSCIILAGIFSPFALAFLRLIAWRGRARPVRRPRRRR
jgi:hypothetical protein